MRPWYLLLTLIFSLTLNCGCSTFSKNGKSRSGGLFGGSKRQTTQYQPDISQEALDPLGARDVNRLLISDFAPSQIATTLRTRGKTRADENKAREYYQLGLDKYRSANQQRIDDGPAGRHQAMFTEAANDFRSAGAFYPDSQLEEDALYYEGESYFFADRYVQSNRAFEKLIAKYTGSRYLDHAEQRRLAIALYWHEMSRQYAGPKFGDPQRPATGLAGEARRVMHRVRIDDPTGKFADDATLALGKAFMAANRYYEAADTFEDLRMNYPGSKHHFTAHLLELEARLKGYQGASYDDTPLRKAEEILQSVVRQFPGETQQHLDYLEAQNLQVQNLLVERDIATGMYYENRGENRSAQLVYEKLADKYQGTQFANSIQQRIADLEGKPATPTPHGQWIVDLFPRRDDHIPLIAAGDNESIFR